MTNSWKSDDAGLSVASHLPTQDTELSQTIFSNISISIVFEKKHFHKLFIQYIYLNFTYPKFCYFSNKGEIPSLVISVKTKKMCL